MPKISVLIPVYNVEQYFRHALESVLNQTLQDIEIIIIDDGSPDNCPKIADEYAKKDTRIKIIHKTNGGYGSAMNIGFDKAKGEYIAILEPDDFIDSKMYEDLYDIARQYDSDIVKSCFFECIDSKQYKKTAIPKWNNYIPENKSFTIEEYPYFLYYHPSIWSCIYKRGFIEKNNIRFIEEKGSGWTDNPFQVQTMCLAKKINYTSKAYYHWRRYSMDESDDLKDYSLPFRRSEEIHDWLENNNINNEKILSCLYRRELAYIYIVLGMKNINNKKDCYLNISKALNRMGKKIPEKYFNNKEYKFYMELLKNPENARRKISARNKLKQILRLKLSSKELYLILFNRKIFQYSFKKNENLNIVPLVFAINNGYTKQFATAIASILKNSFKATFLEINILYSDLSKENIENIKKLERLKKNCCFKFINIKEHISNLNLSRYMSRRENYEYISEETYFRFLIPELFKNYNKVLYLDADILVFKDLKELFDTDIDDYYCGATEDMPVEALYADSSVKSCQYPDISMKEYFEKKLKKSNNKYFNAGVLLLNLKKIREDNITEKLWEFAKNECPLDFQDQDILNAVFENNVKYLPMKWNVLKIKWWFANKPKKIRRKLKRQYKNPCIFHFAGIEKPWAFAKNQDYFFGCIKDWWKYYKLTPFFEKKETEILKNITSHRKCHYYRKIFKLGPVKIYIKKYKLNIIILKRIKLSFKLREPTSYDSV